MMTDSNDHAMDCGSDHLKDPMHPGSAQPPAVSQGVSPDVLHDIERFLEDGLPVFDRNGQHIGAVKMYRTPAGYLLVGSGALGHRDLYLPYRLIRRITPQEGIAVAEPLDVLTARYTEPPTVHTLVENRIASGTQQQDTPDTPPPAAPAERAEEVRVVPSGYDGLPTVVDRVALGSIADRLSLGLAVYDAEGVQLGDITEYDTDRRVLMVEQRHVTPHVLLVPFSAIACIDRDALELTLTLPRAALVAQQELEARLSSEGY